jgi:chromate transporter
MLIMLFIAWAYERYGTSPQALGILYGIRAAVVGIVLWAIIDLGRRLLKRWTLVILAAGVAGLSLIGINPVLLIVAGGLIVSAASKVQPKPRVGMLALTSGLALPAWSGGKLLTVFLTLLKLGVVSFGSGYVLYAFLHADFVQGLHWLTDKQLIDAIAIGQATPGPVFTTATFLGYLFAGVPGALLLRSLISGTAKTSGGLRLKLNPDSLARASAEQGLSFTKLASAAGLSRPTVSLAAQGGLITPRSAFKIADALTRGLHKDAGSVRP